MPCVPPWTGRGQREENTSAPFRVVVRVLTYLLLNHTVDDEIKKPAPIFDTRSSNLPSSLIRPLHDAFPASFIWIRLAFSSLLSHHLTPGCVLRIPHPLFRQKLPSNHRLAPSPRSSGQTYHPPYIRFISVKSFIAHSSLPAIWRRVFASGFVFLAYSPEQSYSLSECRGHVCFGVCFAVPAMD